MTPEPESKPNHASATPSWMIALAWIFVGAPLLWGVYRTLMQSLTLFRHA